MGGISFLYAVLIIAILVALIALLFKYLERLGIL